MAARFPTTRWSRVVRAGDPADPALGPHSKTFAATTGSRSTPSPDAGDCRAHEAEDIVQGFLADLLERGDLASVDRSKGRFRAFLRAACEHYLANRRDHDRAAKRGGYALIFNDPTPS